MEIVEYDISDIKQQIISFKNKFGVLENLPEETKMCISDDDTLYIDTTPRVLQKIVRKFREQTREKINTFLETKFRDYNILLKMITETYNSEKNNEIIEIIKNTRAFNRNIAKGLNNTKNVYSEYLEINSTIDRIIGEIVEFNLLFESIINTN